MKKTDIVGAGKIREKNQLTLPSELMTRVHLKIGDSVCFVEKDGEIVLKKLKLDYEDFK